jgi:antitoxin YefM
MIMNNLMSISNVRANLPDIVAKIGDAFGRVTITVNGQPKAILVSAEELESLEETAEILAIPGAKEAIRQGLKEAKKGQGTPLSGLR